MRTIRYLSVLALVGLVVTGCAASTGKEMPFTVIAEGDAADSYAAQQGLVVASPGEWETLWGQIHRDTIPQPAMPEADFAQRILLVVFAGEKRSGGYAIQVERVTQTDQKVVVYVTETAPGPNDMTIALIAHPYQVVKIPYTNLPVQFRF